VARPDDALVPVHGFGESGLLWQHRLEYFHGCCAVGGAQSETPPSTYSWRAFGFEGRPFRPLLLRDKADYVLRLAMPYVRANDISQESSPRIFCSQ